jgi:hypothetical protein
MSPNPSSTSSSDLGSPIASKGNGFLSPVTSSTPPRPKKTKAKHRRKQKVMKATVKPVYKAATTAKKGYIYLMYNATDEDGTPANEWRQVYAILRRPYLSLYKNASEEEELPNLINISTVRVDHSPQLEEVLSVSSVLHNPCACIDTCFCFLFFSASMHSVSIPQSRLFSSPHLRSQICSPGSTSLIRHGVATSKQTVREDTRSAVFLFISPEYVSPHFPFSK